MKLPRSQWPEINDPADVDPALDQLQRVHDRYAPLVDPYRRAIEARNAARDRIRRRIADLPEGEERSRLVGAAQPLLIPLRMYVGDRLAPPIEQVVGMLDQLAHMPERVDPVTEPISAARFGGFRRNASDWFDPRPFAAYWSNRRGLDQLKSARRDNTVPRSEFADLTKHVNSTLFNAVRVEMRQIGPAFENTTWLVDHVLGEVDRGIWDVIAPTPIEPPPPPIPAQLRF